MSMEARFRTHDGERIYRTGLAEIVNGEDGIHLAYGDGGAKTGAQQALTGEGEFLEGAEIEVVKLEGDQSIEEQDALVEQFQADPEAFEEKYDSDQ